MQNGKIKELKMWKKNTYTKISMNDVCTVKDTGLIMLRRAEIKHTFQTTLSNDK